MNYNSFTQKKKLPNAELNNQVQANAISLQQFIESKINSRVVNTQPRNLNLTSTVQWDSGWSLMDSNLTNEMWKSWKLSIGRINQNWLTNFQIEIVCKNGVSGELDSSGFQVSTYYGFKKFIGWDIKDVEGSETSDMKDVSLVASVYSALLNQPIFYVQVLVKYINQSNLD